MLLLSYPNVHSMKWNNLQYWIWY